MVDIFDEVEEELRAERTQLLLKKYGGVMIAAAVLVVAAVGAWQGWRWWQARQDMAFAGQFLSAMSIADSAGDKAKQQQALGNFERISANAPEGYATLARLRAAALKAQTGDMPGAIQLWNAVASDGSAPPLLRDLASLLWAQHQLDSGDPNLLAARLKPLASPDNAWHAQALEQLAVLDIRQGKPDAAKTELRKVAQDVTAPNGVRGRAAALLGQLGG